MRATRRTPKLLILLTAVVTAISLAVPFGAPSLARAAEVGEWVPGQYGQYRISSVAPQKSAYEVGDVVTLKFRFETTDATAPNREIVTTSDTLSNADSCTWYYPASVSNPPVPRREILPGGTGASMTVGPLARNGAWTAEDGRQWTTECDNATTGRGGCRSYVWADVWQPVTAGSNQFELVQKWVLNNMVRFS